MGARRVPYGLRPARQPRRVLDARPRLERCPTDEHPGSTACFACMWRRPFAGLRRGCYVPSTTSAPRRPSPPDRGRSRENILNVRLAVNGTLMRGLALNDNLLAAGATFVRETTTAPHYRLWSIDDRHPA